MSKTYKVTIYRSKEWLLAQRLETGTNVPVSIDVDVDPATLSMEARKIWLEAGSDKYCSFGKLGFDQTRLLYTSYSGWGAEGFAIDSHCPTPDEIGAAIVKAYGIVCQKIAEAKSKEEYRKAVEAEEVAEKQRKADAIKAARELLAKELGDGKKWQERLEVVSAFLAEVPEDALRGTAKKVAATSRTAEEVMEEVEHAATWTIFSVDNDD